MPRSTPRLSLLRSDMAKNTSWLLAGQFGSLGLRAVSFLFLARLLGVKEYGIFAGAFALVSVATPYSDLGFGLLFMRDVSKDRASAKTCWGNALLITLLCTVVFSTLAFLTGPFIAGTGSRGMFLALTLGNCLFLQITIIASKVFQIYEKMKAAAFVNLTADLTRCAAVITMLLTIHFANASQWSWVSMSASALAAVLALILAGREVGGARFRPQLIVKRLREGLQYSMAGSSRIVYNDIDKTMLSHYGFISENGFYTLAYRIIDVATAPIASLEMACLPRFFHLNLHAAGRLARRSVLTAILIALGMVSVILLSSPLVPHLVGRDFSGTVSVLRWLCWILVFRGVHLITGAALTGSGNQAIRTRIQFSIAMLNILLNLWWIPRWGWMGAASGSIVCDGLLALLYSGVLIAIVRREPQEEIPAAPPESQRLAG